MTNPWSNHLVITPRGGWRQNQGRWPVIWPSRFKQAPEKNVAHHHCKLYNCWIYHQQRQSDFLNLQRHVSADLCLVWHAHANTEEAHTVTDCVKLSKNHSVFIATETCNRTEQRNSISQGSSLWTSNQDSHQYISAKKCSYNLLHYFVWSHLSLWVLIPCILNERFGIAHATQERDTNCLENSWFQTSWPFSCIPACTRSPHARKWTCNLLQPWSSYDSSNSHMCVCAYVCLHVSLLLMYISELVSNSSAWLNLALHDVGKVINCIIKRAHDNVMLWTQTVNW